MFTVCYGCWVEYGSPTLHDDRIARAAALAAEVYEHNAVGGNLHIVLDDWNLEDHNIDYCLEQIGRGGWEGRDDPAQLAVERECGELLRALTEDERASALALWEGFFKPGEQSHRPTES